MSARPEPKIPGSQLPNADGEFQATLIGWFEREGRDYPWRRTTDPYAILVSEIMLQQTQIATVLQRGYYGRWLEKFPDVETLAAAEEEAVLKAWEGLGYYSRARNLQKAARVIRDEYGGKFPATAAEVQELPGVGRYTTGAVMSFAYNDSVALVDGNVARLFARLFNYSDPVDSTAGQKQLWAWAEELLPPKNARAYNAALMEIGQRFCTPRAPQCDACPVRNFCQAGDPQSLPNKKPRTKTVLVDEYVILDINEEGVLLEQEYGARRKGLWKLPVVEKEMTQGLPLLLKTTYAITHHRVTLYVHQPADSAGVVPVMSVKEGGPQKRVSLAEVEEIAMPSPYRRVLRRFLETRDFTLNG